MKTFTINSIFKSILLLGSAACFSNAHAQLMFSQYIDGSSNKKGIEIYNPDASPVNLADYEIQQFSNGATSKTISVNLTGTLAAKSRFLVGRSELQADLGTAVNQVAGLSFNGDDALLLYYKGTPIDRFGNVGERPAKGWGTSVFSLSNSFSRIQNHNDVSAIDPTKGFDLESGWKVWTDRNDFSNIVKNTSPTPVETAISCASTDTAIADLNTAAQGENYTVRGVITADYRYQNGFSGFYLQTPDSKAKADVSNAIFVYVPASSTIKGGSIGQEVILRGRLTSYQNQLQLDQLAQNIQTCNSNASNLVTAKELNLPFESLTNSTGHTPKRYQGMWVKLPQTLTVSENYNYGRFGELSLSPERLYIPTNLYAAQSNEAKALAQKNLLSKIILDDGFNAQNLTPWLPSHFSASQTLRVGDQLKNVQGILEYRFNAWRIQPIPDQTKPELIQTRNPRSTLLAKDNQHIRVAAFNVLNYDNGATGFPTARGAHTATEFERQHAKIVSALKQIDADVYGLMEIANNGYDSKSAIAYLTQALGADWKYVIPENQSKLGTDVIAVAILYNAKRVKPINKAVTLDLGDKSRTTIAQSFQPISGGKIFTVVPNHLKSKGSCPEDKASADADQNDGQGCWNPTRIKATQQLIQWFAKNPTQVNQANILLLGDLNSYAKEDPIQEFEKANYKVLLNDEKIGQGKSAYSYVFGVASNALGYGGSGNLDHAIADAGLYPQVKRAFAWHINADEPTALDYNEEYKTDQQISQFYAADAYRSSDHDPVIVDLDLNPEAQGHRHGGGSFGLWSIFALMMLAVAATLRRRQV